MHLVFLGTSSSIPLPREGCHCCQCSSEDPRDKRGHASLLVEGKYLFDCGPNILSQLRREGLSASDIKEVFLTHWHEDASGGVDDLRRGGFAGAVRHLRPGTTTKLNSLVVRSFSVPHSKEVRTLAYEIEQGGKTALYATDFNTLTPRLLKGIQKADCAILDGSIFEGAVFGKHLPMKKTLERLARVRSRLPKIYFSHIGHVRMPHKVLRKKLKTVSARKVALAYDGLRLSI